MEATHRVKDNDGNTLGYMIDGRFIAISLVKDNTPDIENLTVQKNGTIRAKRTLPELHYKDAVIKAAYKNLIQENPFERNIQSELEHWRSTRYRQVLQLGGPRQVGKTTELLKFAYKNYEYVIYVNLADDRFRFTALSDSADIWLDMQNYCDRAHLPRYRDDRNTILILDEIQTSKKVYNSIRAMRSALKCDIAVTGSYLGTVFHTEGYFLPAGTITYIDMTAMKANRTLVDSSSLEGLLTETFVFNELRYLFGQKSAGNRVTGDNVCFSTCGAYELDFMLASSDRTVYGIEAKTAKGNPLSLRVFIDKHYIDRGIVVKSTAGGHGDKFDTIPIYTVGCRFPYE